MDDGDEKPPIPASGSKRKAEWFDIDEEHNTYVYVTGLPTSITEEDFIDLMRKYGIIAKKTVAGSPYNVKLYRDKEGTFKGDALCRYVRVESVELALTHLDGYQYDDKHLVHCERAKFEMKGNYDPSKKPRIDQRTKMKQKKTVEKLLSWEASSKPGADQKKVILKHMFTLDEIREDAGLILDIQEDVEAKCSEISCEPKKVEIFDKHPDGVVAVTFAEPHQALACIEALDYQFYAGRVVKAELWDGKTRYKVQETDEDELRRLEKWKQDIEKPSTEDEYNQEAKSDEGVDRSAAPPSHPDS